MGPGDSARGLGVPNELPPPIYPRLILTTSPSHRQLCKPSCRSVFPPSDEFVPHSGAGSAWLARHTRAGGGGGGGVPPCVARRLAL